MLFKINTLFLAIIYLTSIYADSYFEKCRFSDEKINACLTDNTMKMLPSVLNGIPELKLEMFKSFAIGDVTLRQSSTLIDLKNASYEMVTTRINSVKLDPTKNILTLNLTQTGDIIFQISFAGELVITPLVTKTVSIITSVTTFVYKINYVVVKGDDNEDHWKISQHKVTLYVENLQYTYKNVPRNEEVYRNTFETVKIYLGQNWKSYVNNFSPVMIRITDKIVAHIDKIFHAIPIKDMFLP
ncbi:uncharacterized protein LOC143910370 [Arctopsyche grandis]|uniref:uncharacterized protein LOC143910370 n=1 Tax=Arctopsyche grandis TaxID=121162 RepID=UPI00406D8D5C